MKRFLATLLCLALLLGSASTGATAQNVSSVEPIALTAEKDPEDTGVLTVQEIRAEGLAPDTVTDEEIEAALAEAYSHETWNMLFRPPDLHDDPHFVKWDHFRPWFNFCDGPWAGTGHGWEPCTRLEDYPHLDVLYLNDNPDGTLNWGEKIPNHPYRVEGGGSVVYIRDNRTGEVTRYEHIGLFCTPWGGCSNAYGDPLDMWGEWTGVEWPSDDPEEVPGEIGCDWPEAEPLPYLPTDNIAPLLTLTDPSLFFEELDRVVRLRASHHNDNPGDGGGGGGFELCSEDPLRVINFDADEVVLLPVELPLIERDGKVFFPAERKALDAMGISGWVGHPELSMVTREILYLGNNKHVVAVFPGEGGGYTLWDLLKVQNTETFLSESDTHYYFDLEQIVRLFEGRLLHRNETEDGLYKILIPQDEARWATSCIAKGVSPDSLEKCPDNKWVHSTTWQFYYRAGDAVDSITMVQGAIMWYKPGPYSGKDPDDIWGLQNSQIRNLNTLGNGWEFARFKGWGTYGQYWMGYADFTLESGLVALDILLAGRLAGYFDQWKTNPARTVELSKRATEIAKQEELLLAVRGDQIRRHVLEEGLNLIEEEGKMVSLPVTVNREKPVAGKQARIYGYKSYQKGGWYNQTKIAGTGDPVIFELDGMKYVLVVEWAVEQGGRALDGVGMPLNPKLPQKISLLEVKAGYGKFINPETGDFFQEFRHSLLTKMIEDFRLDILQAEAIGGEAYIVFTNDNVAKLFIKHATAELGAEFMEANAHRVKVQTTQFLRPLNSGDPLKPAPPCLPGSNCPSPTGG